MGWGGGGGRGELRVCYLFWFCLINLKKRRVVTHWSCQGQRCKSGNIVTIRLQFLCVHTLLQRTSSGEISFCKLLIHDILNDPAMFFNSISFLLRISSSMHNQLGRVSHTREKSTFLLDLDRVFFSNIMTNVYAV